MDRRKETWRDGKLKGWTGGKKYGEMKDVESWENGWEEKKKCRNGRDANYGVWQEGKTYEEMGVIESLEDGWGKKIRRDRRRGELREWTGDKQNREMGEMESWKDGLEEGNMERWERWKAGRMDRRNLWRDER